MNETIAPSFGAFITICTRTAAVALAAAALAAPVACARPTNASPAHAETSVPTQDPQDLRLPDTRDRANSYLSPLVQDLRSLGTRDLANAFTPPVVQGLNSPDTRDLANGRATTHHDGINATTWALLAIALVASAAVLGTVARHGRGWGVGRAPSRSRALWR